ncbi:MAG: methyltransferase domain-containing protein [Bryobacteraceae bacterium]
MYDLRKGQFVHDAGNELTDLSYWEVNYSTPLPSPETQGRKWKPAWLRAASQESTLAQHIFWNLLLPRFVQKPPGSTVLEVGSAPGRNLIEFYNRFRYVPFGIEYSAAGAEINRALFVKHGLDAKAVIHADLFDDRALAKYHQRFDIVYSGGLIEHFQDPRPAIERHVSLLAPSGILIVTIPNLRGLNWLLCRASCPDRLITHNIGIMNHRYWSDLFREKGLTQLLSGYYGMLDLGLIDGPHSNLGQFFLRTARTGNFLLNAAFRRLPSALRLESRWTSPNLIYIGRKV